MQNKYLVPPKILDSLTILRGPAALYVFLFHIVHNTAWISQYHIERIASIGFIGVSLFFILSGFVLTWSYKPGQKFRAFYIRRFARVYPLHLFFAIIALAFSLTVFDPSAGSVVMNIFLLQAWFPSWNYIFSVNAVSWSLSVEFFFYAIAPLFLVWILGEHRKKRVVLSIVFISIIMIVAVSISSISNNLDIVVYSNPLARTGEFLLGSLAALAIQWAYAKEKLSYITPAVSVFLLAFSSLGTLAFLWKISGLKYGQTITSFLAVPVFIILIASAAIYNIKNREFKNYQIGRQLRNLLIFLGEVSFAFYLVHEMIIHFVNSASLDAPLGNSLILLIFTFITSLILAILAHKFIELPMQRYILRKFK